MKKILVTGAFGFIAGYVAEELKKQGYYIVGTVHHVARELPDNFDELYLADMRDKAAIYSAIEHVDGVIHLAGLLGTTENMRQAELLNEVNIGGALNVLNACDNFKIPLSMIAVGNHFENNCYSISKTTAERYGLMYAKNFQTPVNIVRALNAFGPKQKFGKIRKIIPTFINAALKSEPLYVYGGKNNCSLMDMVYVGDVAKVLIESLKNASKGDFGNIYEAGTGIGYPVWKIAEMILDITNSKSELIEVPIRQGETTNSRVVSDNPYPIEYRDVYDALVSTVDYYRSIL